MWNWINCYMSGRHDYGVWCEPGAIFLRCIHCGRRSAGWAMDPKGHAHNHASVVVGAPRTAHVHAVSAPRVLPFDRASAS
jgi:hypothetical protein